MKFKNDGWQTLKLDEIGEVVGGGTPSTKISEYYGGCIPWITPKDLSGYKSKYIFRGERNITEKGLKNSSAILLPKGSVLFSSRAPIGYIAIAGCDVATNQGFKSIIPNEEIISSDFLYYLLKYNVETIKNQGSGSTFSEISGKVMKSIEVSVPTRETQDVISMTLSSLDSKIELNNKIIANLEDQAQAIFKSWFIDFEPFQDGDFVESELGLIPEGWKASTTGKEFDIEYGKNLPTKHLSEKGYPVFGGNGQIGFFREYLYEKPRILVSCRGAASGKVGLSEPYSYVTNNSLVFNEKREEYFYYFKYLFNGIQFENYVTGSAQPQLTIANSKDIKILIPKKEIVLRFNIIVGPYFTNQLTLSEENKTLAQIRDTLLPKLMSGEIDVSNITIDSEEDDHV